MTTHICVSFHCQRSALSPGAASVLHSSSLHLVCRPPGQTQSALCGTSSLTYHLPPRYQPYQGHHPAAHSRPPPADCVASYGSSCSSDAAQVGLERGVDPQPPAGRPLDPAGPSGEYGYTGAAGHHPDASQVQGRDYSGWCRLATCALPAAAFVLVNS